MKFAVQSRFCHPQQILGANLRAIYPARKWLRESPRFYTYTRTASIRLHEQLASDKPQIW